MTELSEITTEKVKKFLNIQGEIDAFGLYDIVYDFMINCHPDKYQDELKKEAEEKFKILNNFLSELKREIDYLRLTKKPSEIVIYEKSFEIVKSKSEVIMLKEEIERLKLQYSDETESLKNSVKSKEYEIQKLNLELENLKNERLTESIDELKQLYKPSKTGLITIGVSGVLLLFMSITTQFDSFKSYLVNFSPIDPIIINWTLFVILILTFLTQLFSLFKRRILRKICDKIISQRLINEFYEYKVKEEILSYSKYKFFTERDVEDFILERFTLKKQKRNRLSFESITLIDDFKSINYLKNVFIDNLLTKKYITIGNSKDMDRHFVIK